MLTIQNIDKLHNQKFALNGDNWRITKINKDPTDNYYGIVIRKENSAANDYVVHYLKREKKNGHYYISSNRTNIEREVSKYQIYTIYNFLRLLRSETQRAIC